MIVQRLVDDLLLGQPSDSHLRFDGTRQHRIDNQNRILLAYAVKELFPEGLDFDDVEFWAGLRPMTPDGPPILGRTRWRNLMLNSGHGSNGWTQSCGTGKIVADLVHGRTPGIDMDGLTLARFGA